jgi:hypothetical protein
MTVKPTKHTYKRPVLERITLVGEETAAVPNCKRSNGGGRSQTYPNPCDIRSVGKCRDNRGS